MTTMTTTETHTLSTAELQVALRLAGMPPSRNSPLAQLPPPAVVDPAVVSSLRALGVTAPGGALVPDWIEALSAIANPARHAVVFLGSSANWTAIEYFAGPSAMAGYSLSEGKHNITFPCTAESLKRSISAWLAVDGAPALPPFSSDLQPEELAAVAAIADAYREETLRALLERRAPDPSRFSQDQLVYELQAVASRDPRWFCSLLANHAPAPFAPSVDSLDAGIRALSARGWVRFEEGRAVLKAPLIAISVGLGVLNPYAVIGTGPAGAPVSLALVTCALQGYWSLNFVARDAQSYVRLESLGGPDLSAWLEARLLDLPRQAAVASWTDPLPASIPVSVPVLSPVTAVAVRRPVPVPVPVAAAAPLAGPNCERCGKPKQPGRKFCTGCGAAIV